MTNIGSGLDSQFGMANESTFGTLVTASRFFEITDGNPTLNPTYISSEGLRAGKRFKRAAQVGISKVTAGGDITMPATKKNMGVWYKHLMGSTASATLIAGSAYKQIHVPGTTMRGLSFSAQLGKPEPSTGTVVPFTYNGCKVTDWSIDIQDGQETSLKVSFDCVNEVTTTALATASYVSSNDTWNFADASVFKIGGVASTGSGEVSVSGGAAVASVVSSFSLKGSTSYANDRYGVGNAGFKLEQIENGFCQFTGDFSGEFNKAQFYDNFNQGNTVALQLDHVGEIISGSDRFLLSIIIPAAKISDHSADVSGPDLVSVKGSFTVYDDEVNAPIQVKIVSSDTVV